MAGRRNFTYLQHYLKEHSLFFQKLLIIMFLVHIALGNNYCSFAYIESKAREEDTTYVKIYLNGVLKVAEYYWLDGHSRRGFTLYALDAYTLTPTH